MAIAVSPDSGGQSVLAGIIWWHYPEQAGFARIMALTDAIAGEDNDGLAGERAPQGYDASRLPKVPERWPGKRDYMTWLRRREGDTSGIRH